MASRCPHRRGSRAVGTSGYVADTDRADAHGDVVEVRGRLARRATAATRSARSRPGSATRATRGAEARSGRSARTARTTRSRPFSTRRPPGCDAGAIVFPQPASEWAIENCGALIATRLSDRAAALGRRGAVRRARVVARARRSIVMPPGGATTIGTFGAMSAAFELAEQIAAPSCATAATDRARRREHVHDRRPARGAVARARDRRVAMAGADRPRACA